MFGRTRTSVRVANEAFGIQTEPLDTENEIAAGGGVDMSFRKRFSIRVIQVDYIHTSLFDHDQNNLRFSTGLVYHWGRPPAQTAPCPQHPHALACPGDKVWKEWNDWK